MAAVVPFVRSTTRSASSWKNSAGRSSLPSDLQSQIRRNLDRFTVLALTSPAVARWVLSACDRLLTMSGV